MSFNSQKGVVTLATILLGFTIASLLTAGAGVYTHVEERIELSKVVKTIRDNAHTLKKHHADDPRAWAQAEAWERMARSIESHKDIIYSQKMLKEAATLGINLIPGKLPFKKGTKEVIEFAKDIYDTDSALEEAWRDQPQEVSPEMKDFFKALSKGKVDADALEIAMLHTREQALIRKWEEFLAEKKAQEEWQRQQEEQQQEYREMFIQNTINKLKETGSLPSTYKRLWKQSGLQKELANYPQIADALKETEVSVTQKEKQEIDDIVHGVVSQNEALKEALAESLTKKQGDWEKDIAQIVEQMSKIATEGVEIPEEEEKVPPIKEEKIIDKYLQCEKKCFTKCHFLIEDFCCTNTIGDGISLNECYPGDIKDLKSSKESCYKAKEGYCSWGYETEYMSSEVCIEAITKYLECEKNCFREEGCSVERLLKEYGLSE